MAAVRFARCLVLEENGPFFWKGRNKEMNHKEIVPKTRRKLSRITLLEFLEEMHIPIHKEIQEHFDAKKMGGEAAHLLFTTPLFYFFVNWCVHFLEEFQ